MFFLNLDSKIYLNVKIQKLLYEIWMEFVLSTMKIRKHVSQIESFIAVPKDYT